MFCLSDPSFRFFLGKTGVCLWAEISCHTLEPGQYPACSLIIFSQLYYQTNQGVRQGYDFVSGRRIIALRALWW